MQIVKTSLFLNKYKELEKAIRENMQPDSSDLGSVAYYEEELKKEDTDKAEMFRYFRTMRNIATHNPGLENIIITTDTHLKILDEHIHKIESINGTVKDVYLTPAKAGLLSIKDTVKDACKMFAQKKFKSILVYDEKTDRTLLLTESDIIRFINDNGKLIAQIVKIPDLPEITQKLDVSESLVNIDDIPATPMPVYKGKKLVGVYRGIH